MVDDQIKYAGFESETAEQKKLRERRQIEDADEHLLMEEMMGEGGGGGSPRSTSSGGVGGLVGLSVKNKDEHVAFALLVAKKMEVMC